METVSVEILRLPHAPGELPSYQTAGAAGMDVRLAADDVEIDPGQTRLLPTGFCVAIPPGYEGQIRLRSGFAFSTGLVIPNAPGTVDSDYRGEVKVVVLNGGRERVRIPRHERFAQLIIAPVARCRWVNVEELPESPRSEGGFGSTGRE